MADETTVLVTGAGGPAGMGTIKGLKLVSSVKIVGADMNPLAPGLFWIDRRTLLHPVNSKDFIERLIHVLQKEKIDVLIPTVDEEISVLANNMEKLEKYVHLIISDAEANKICDDKLAVYQFLSRRNVPVVETRLIESEEDLRNAEKELAYPFALKPQCSRGGRGLYYCHNEKDALKAFHELKNILPFKDTFYDPEKSKSIICQEYLPGVEYDVNFLRERNGSTVACVPMKAEEWDVAKQHRTIVTEHNPEVKKAAEDIVNALNLIGPLDVELMYDKHGHIKLLDLNPRIGGDVELATAAGCNIPYLTTKLALGEKLLYTDFKDDYILIRYLGIQTLKKSDVPSI